MKITIITATLNNAATIGRTIESVITQSYKDIEHIIIDGGSSDDSLTIIQSWQKSFPDKIKYISEPDSGVYHAINKGIDLAQGEVIGILHGNDTFSNNDILQQVATAMQESSTELVYGDIHYIKTNGNRCIRKYSSKNFTPEMLRIGIAPPHPSLYVKRNIFKQYGKYKEDYLIGADFELFVRLMLVNGIIGKYVPIDMVAMTTGGLSTRLYHRIFTNNREKYRALRENSININRFSLLKRYLYTLKNSDYRNNSKT